MFKRITRKQKRRERDEELGLDDDTKQMFDLKDNDSDDSSSDSESQLSNDDAADLDPASAADLRTEWIAAEGGDSEDEDDEGESDEEEELGLDEDFDDDPPISLDEAVKNPIYNLPLSSRNERACITCPKKVLKYDRMVESHLSSAAHIRRFKKFCELAESTKNRSKDPRRITASISLTTKPTLNAEGLSNRAIKRKRKLEAVKQKREKRKEIIERKKKKSANKHEEADAVDKGNKKRKTEDIDKTPAVLSNSDERTSEEPHKRRKLSHTKTAGQESGGLEGSKNEIPEERTVPNKSSKKAKTKVKLDLKKADAQIPAGSVSVSKPKGKDKIAAPLEANKQAPKVKSLKDGGNSKDENAHPIKKRDLLKMKTKGHMGREHAGRFAKLSETRVVKDKSDRNSRHQGNGAVRKPSIARKAPVRYFDGPDDEELESKKIDANKGKSEAQKRNRAAGNVGANRLQKSLSRQVEQAPDDLAIFD